MPRMLLSFCFLILFSISFLPIANQAGGLAGCNNCDEVQFGYPSGTFNRYTVSLSKTTPGGIAYDPSGLPINPALIDRLVTEVSDCLSRAYPGGHLPGSVNQAALCRGDFALPINRGSFVVKVATDYTVTPAVCLGAAGGGSFGGKQQLLPVASAEAACLAKGEKPNAACPCQLRAGIKCNLPGGPAIIVPPNFYVFKDALTRLATGCQLIARDSSLAKCAIPSTGPLSDGTGP